MTATTITATTTLIITKTCSEWKPSEIGADKALFQTRDQFSLGCFNLLIH